MSNQLKAHSFFNKPVLRHNVSSILNKDYVLERHRVWLNMTNNEGLFKQLMIGYIEGATNGYDHNYDAVSMNANSYADFYSINDGQKLVIQGRSLPFLSTDIVPLGYRSEIEGDLNISIDHLDGDLTNQNIYLEDTKTGIIHNLKKSMYTFSTEKGTFLDRFIIRYEQKKTLGRDEFAGASENLIIISKNKMITLKSYEVPLQDVYIYDVSGRLIYNKLNIKTFDLEIDNLFSTTQVLLIKTIFEGGKKKTQKIMF